MSTEILNISKLAAAELRTQPFEFVCVDDFLQAAWKQAVVKDFPPIGRTGSFPLSRLQYGPAFEKLIAELLGKDFEREVSKKFSLDLSQYPTMLTVRGWCSAASDGQIHTDSKSKVISVLLYLNPAWDSSGGRLRLLRSNNLEDYAAEVAPTMGSLIIFKRSDRSWHGHKPFEGSRLSLQMNWVKDSSYVRREQFRHQLSALLKFFRGQRPNTAA